MEDGSKMDDEEAKMSERATENFFLQGWPLPLDKSSRLICFAEV